MIGVMGPGEHATGLEVKLAYDLGRAIAESDWVLLTGGRNVGVMDAASRGAKSVGGLTIGVLPGSDHAQVSNAVDIPIFTNMGQARNVINVLSCDVVIACGMGLGTASEVALALKLEKTVITLNVTNIEHDFFSRFAGSNLYRAANLEQAIAIVHQTLSST